MINFKNLVTATAVLFTVSASAADRFYTNAVDLLPGTDSQLVFMLENTQEYIGFQAELVLPDGITVQDLTLSDRADGTSPLLNYNLKDINLLAITEYSSSRTPFTGSDGALLYVNIHVNDQFAGGELTTQNIFFSNVSDIETEIESSTVNLGVKNSTTNTLYIPDFTIVAGGKKSVALVLDNTMSFCAFQTDIYMPDGLSIIPGSFVLTDRAKGTLDAKSRDGGCTRVVLNSTTPFTGNSGELVYFEVEASADTDETLEIFMKNSILTAVIASNVEDFKLDNTITKVNVDKTSGISDSGIENLMVTTSGNTIYVDGLLPQTHVELYSVDGKLIESRIYLDSTISFNVVQGNIYIIKAGSTTYKISL